LAETRDERRRLVVGERRERDRRRVQLPAAPLRSSLEQLDPRRAEDQHRYTPHPVREMLDEVEKAVVRPLDVLEDEHERPALRHPFEEATPRGERVLARRTR